MPRFLCILVACGVSLYAVKAERMTPSNTQVDSFEVVGIEVRTTNAREMTAQGSIPKLWDRVMKEGLLQEIPNRDGPDVIVLNTNYESNKDGEYTYVLGVKVSSARDIPAGMSIHKVPAGEYAKFSALEESPTAVVGVWRNIWSLEGSGQLKRAYQTDFEVHHKSTPGENGKPRVDVFIGLKK
ncbi:MAG: GyrI-like domain-containing protein [Acidobacteriota bacterium]|nr:GyrI-like domain-containing protein [Acidobacteriota bacterium]